MLYLRRWCNHLENMTLASSMYNEYFMQWTLLSVHNLDSLKEVLHLLWYLHLQENQNASSIVPNGLLPGIIKALKKKMRKLQCKEQRRKEEIWFRSFQAQTNVQHDKLKATPLFCFITLISTGGSPEESLERQLIPDKQKHSQVTLKTHQGHQALKNEGSWLFPTMENAKKQNQNKKQLQKNHHRKQQKKPTPNSI